MKKGIDALTSFFTQGDLRTIKAKKNILALIIIKSINIITGFLVVPLTINYVNASSYGIWLAISSIVIWVSNFDLGLPNGFRNKFAEAIATNNHILARKYVSTTYILLSLIFTTILGILIISNETTNWSTFLHVDYRLATELHYVFLVISIFFSIRIVASIFLFMLMADQRPALAATIQTAGQVIALATIFVLTITTKGNLLFLALALAGMPCLTLLFTSCIAFRFRPYYIYAPSIQYIDFKLTKKILGIGIQFFLVTIINILILQIINIVVSRELGSMAVAQYNIAFKYFSVVYIATEMIVAPFWSGYTEAYTKQDFKWMHNISSKLEFILLLSIPFIILMCLGTDFVIRFWIGNAVTIPYTLSIAMGLFVFFQSAYCMYSNLVNGIGKVKIQLISFLVTGLVAIPCIEQATRYLGLWGCLLLPTIAYAIIALLCRYQVKRVTY
jgi:O-antigen/teichoic acid export membrane protein